MKMFITKFPNAINGSISCFDRVIFKGHLPPKGHPKGQTSFFIVLIKSVSFPHAPFPFFDIFIGRLQLMLRNVVGCLCDFDIEITEERKALLRICCYASFPFFSLCKNTLFGK
jgi:hypothetical protein